MLLLKGYISNFTCAGYYFLYVEFSDFFMSTNLSLNKLFHYTGISKIILVKGGHGLENVRLNLFRVTISSVRTIGLRAPFL
jgi:hypothetical protein